jgi:excinuclease ABC subunit B
MYADHVTESMAETLRETERRRALQAAYNAEHGITPETIRSTIRELLQTVYERDYYTVEAEAPAPEAFESPAELARRIADLETQMKDAARRLDFEQAAELRDRVKGLRRQQVMR